jgi:5-(carboxyamino)imidazole ribonucleotide synthase
MAQQAAIGLGINLRVLAAAPKDSAALVINDVRVGNHDDARAVFAFADGVDVITFDHEHVPPSILRELQASGVAVRPGPDALIHAQDKVAMRRALTDAGLPCPGWAVIDADAQALEVRAQLEEFGERVGWPLMLKTSRGGYDGRGVWVADSVEAAVEIIEQNPLTAPAAWLLEERVDFRRELAAQIARSPHGQAVAYPVVETVQTDGICREVIAPAPDLDSDLAISAQSIALRVAEVVGVTGMLAVELFETADGLLINELAMRPHNSGHWSIDGAVTSQFENHLRAVLDLPLGSPAARAPYSVMVNVIGTDQDHLYSAYRHIMARDPHLKVHLYGKTPRRGRKLGHVTVTGDDLVSLRERAYHAADYLAGVIDE